MGDVQPTPRAWWKESSVYQIYPASFKDSTGSGTGDLKGIISKVDYLHRLGVECVWLSPIFASPQVDMGYDISDYYSIAPEYGSIEDVDVLAQALHAKDMKLVLDLVVNHTSDQHQWFQQSRSSRDNAFRDFYIWRDAKYDAQGNRQPPNNWISHFQGSAWEWDEMTGQYYLRLFAREQPDLNWENPQVRAEVHKIMRFWLDRGCDGFRMDVINFISKDQTFPNSDPASGTLFVGSEYYAVGPRLHEYLKDLGAILKEYNAFNVGEMPFVRDPKEVIKSVKYDRGELNMIFHFEIMDLDHGPQGKFSAGHWTIKQLKEVVAKWQTFMHANGGWNALYIENHDQPRSISRFVSDAPEWREKCAKLMATFLGFQAGTPFIYQGQEIGMTNVPKDWPMEEYKDIDCLNHWRPLSAETQDAQILDAARVEYQKKSRDNARTPMQWDAGKHAGFTPETSTPWMRVNDNSPHINAAAQLDDPRSVFNYWAAILRARKRLKENVVYGAFSLVEPDHDKIIAYKMTAADGSFVLVACNFTADTVPFAGLAGAKIKEVVASNDEKTVADFNDETKLSLSPYEAFAVLCEK